MSEVKIHPSWQQVLSSEFESDYMQKLKQFLLSEKQNHRIYPPGSLIFNAFNSTPFDQVKVVIIGQDPYHGVGQAHGLCFSVPSGVMPPPSLKNIFKELQTDVGFETPNHGCLQTWADQGVLLLNSVLTVRHSAAASHQGQGWERFTDAVIAELNRRKSHIVYMLWGSYAQKKGAQIDTNNNLVLKSVHPSPLSAHRGFFGCQHFSRCNTYLKSQQIEPIHWQLDRV